MSTKVKMEFQRVIIRRDFNAGRKNIFAVKEFGSLTNTVTPADMAEAVQVALEEQFETMSTGDQIEIVLLKKGAFNG